MTEQDNSHTPLPWDGNITDNYLTSMVLKGYAPSDFKTVKSMGANARPVEEVRANAEIVRQAVNQFYENKALISELVEALERIKQRANESGGGQMALINTIHDMNGTARAALKKAGAQ